MSALAHTIPIRDCLHNLGNRFRLRVPEPCRLQCSSCAQRIEDSHSAPPTPGPTLHAFLRPTHPSPRQCTAGVSTLNATFGPGLSPCASPRFVRSSSNTNWPARWAMSTAPLGDRSLPACLVYLDTDVGITGLGLGGPPGTVPRPGPGKPADRIADPRGVRGLWKRMMDVRLQAGPGGSGCRWDCQHIDLALWDLKAKANNEPLWRTLGASSPRVRAYASGLDSPLSDEELHDLLRRHGRSGSVGRQAQGRGRTSRTTCAASASCATPWPPQASGST